LRFSRQEAAWSALDHVVLAAAHIECSWSATAFVGGRSMTLLHTAERSATVAPVLLHRVGN
jgi:hypothetical protein